MEKLIELLPFEHSTILKLDKNALLELILNYLQMKQYLEKGKYISAAYGTDIYSTNLTATYVLAVALLAFHSGTLETII